MLDEMRGDGYSRTTVVMQAIEEKYLLIQARKPTRGLASRPSPELSNTDVVLPSSAEVTETRYTHPDHPGRTFTQAEYDAWPDD
jgi:hypothetical protein